MSSVSSLSFRNVFGLNKRPKPNIIFVGEENVVFSAGNSIVSHNINSRQQRIFNPPDELSTGISAIAYAEGKPNVAFGDNSIQPGICIFDIHSLQPVNYLHLGDDFDSTGFLSLSFSLDGHYLLGHGTKHGWNLVVWSVDAWQLLTIVKTSTDEAPVSQCTFSPGKSPQIAVTGEKVLKVYSLDNNKLKEVQLPPNKIDKIFCHLWINESTLLVADSTGKIINVTADQQTSVIGKIDQKGSPFVTMVRHKKGFIAASESGYLTVFDSTSNPNVFNQTIQIKLFNDELPIPPHSVSVDQSEETAVVSLQNNSVKTVSLSNGDTLMNSEEKPLIMPFHDGKILCCSTCCRKPLIATCGDDKTVRVWNYLDNSQEICKEFTEPVYCVSFHPDGLSMLIGFGDKLRLCSVFYDEIKPIREFSIRGCRCAKFSNGGQLFAAVNGSKIQIYSSLNFQLINTLHRHSGSVQNLIWGEADTVIASVGNDGAMYIHRQDGTNREESYTTAQIQYHSITSVPDFSTMFICGSDNKIKEIQGGQVVREAVFPAQHTQLVMSNNGQMLFSGTKDGKVFSHALPIAGDKISTNCHVGEVTSISISFDDSLLFTTGEDGTLCVFSIRDKDNRIHSLEKTFFSEEVLTTRGEIEEKQNQLRSLKAERDDYEVTYKTKKDMTESNHKSREDERREQAKKEKDKSRIRIENLKKEKDEAEMQNKAEELKQTKLWEDEIAQKESEYGTQIVNAHKVFETLTSEKKSTEMQGELRIKSEKATHQQLMESLLRTNKESIEKKQNLLNEAIARKKESQRQIEEMKKQITGEKVKAIEQTQSELKGTFEDDEKQRNALRDELGNKTKEKLTLKKQSDAQQAECAKLVETAESLQATYDRLKKDIGLLNERMTQRDANIREREKEIGELKKTNQELGKFHSVLSHQETVLRGQTGPLEKQIQAIESEISEMDGKLEAAHKKTTEQNELIAENQGKLQEVIEGERTQTSRLLSAKSYFEQMKHDLHDVIQHFHSKEQLESAFEKFYDDYVKNEKIEDIQLDEAVENEHQRQRATLMKQLKELRLQHQSDDAFQVKEQTKLLMQNSALIEELQRLRSQNKTLNSNAALAKKAPGSARTLLPATEASRLIEENKKQIAKLEAQLSAYHEGSRPST